MFEQKNENSGRLVFCGKCANFKSNDWEDSCHAPENFDHYGTVSERTKYWKESPTILNKNNDCSLFVPKPTRDFSGVIVAGLLVVVLLAILVFVIL